MEFEKGHLFHIYNQGNNRQKIFFKHENYIFFLRKVRIYILPYADILAWCLMPNHFHFMVKVNEVELEVKEPQPGTTHRVTLSQNLVVGGDLASEGFAQSETFAGSEAKDRTINTSIGIMLRSYTNALNKKMKRSGALFRQQTKAECLTSDNGITPSFYNTKYGTQIHVDHPEFQYPQICFNYIHDNPVVAGLVKNPTDWEFSSAQDYAGIRDGKLINREAAASYIDLVDFAD